MYGIYAYVADGGELIYLTDMSTSGTMLLKVYFDSLSDKQTIVKADTSFYTKFSLYRNNQKSVIFEANGKTHELNYLMENNKWYSIGISFDSTIKSGSSPVIAARSFNIVIDDEAFTYFVDETAMEDRFKVSLGSDSKFYKLDEKVEFSSDTNYPLDGQICDFAYSKSCLRVTTLKSIVENFKPTTKITHYNELGIKIGSEIYHGKKVIEDKYLYNLDGKTGLYYGTRIKSNNKIINGKNYAYSYEYDELSNVKGIIYPNNSIAKYDYNERGFIKSESNDYVNRTYTYDDNGNLLSDGHNRFTYNGDRLVTYNGIEVIYDSNYIGNITELYGTKYEYEGRKLTRLHNSVNDISYEYDHNGLRIKKIVKALNGSSTSTSIYEYDGTNIIYEYNGYHKNYYLYDENNELYGFVQDEINTYYYVKDILGNILSVVDINGNEVIKYTYDAWGNILREDNPNNIYNPIRYKSYYYDIESNIYYCQSRYYLPNIYRWLNIDNVNYLDTEDINGVNLFTYCNNNPVMYSDGSGHMPEWLRGLCVLGGAVLVVAAIAAITVATGGTATPVLVGAAIGAGISGSVSAAGQLLSTGTINVGQLLTDTAFGGISGAFGGTTLNLLGMTLSGAGIGFTSSVTGDLVAGNSINWCAAIGSGILGGVIGYFGGAGSQNGKLAGVTKYRGRLNTIKEKGISGDYLKNTLKCLEREKALVISAANKAIYKGIPYSIGTTILDYIL